MQKNDPFGDELPIITTERLRLRQPRMEDAEDMLGIFGDPKAMRYWSHEPWADLDAARTYIAAIDTGFKDRKLFQWAITQPDEDRVIGTVTLVNWDRKNCHIELGYMLKPALWGNGYASEAVRGAMAFAFENLDVHRLEAEVDPRNEPSARLLERLGFKQEGLLKERWFLYDEWSDSALYGLLRREYA